MKKNMTVAEMLIIMGELKKVQTEENSEKYFDFLLNLNEKERYALTNHLEALVKFIRPINE